MTGTSASYRVPPLASVAISAPNTLRESSSKHASRSRKSSSRDDAPNISRLAWLTSTTRTSPAHVHRRVRVAGEVRPPVGHPVLSTAVSHARTAEKSSSQMETGDCSKRLR